MKRRDLVGGHITLLPAVWRQSQARSELETSMIYRARSTGKSPMLTDNPVFKQKKTKQNKRNKTN